jgi:hypothetical protein
MIDIFSETKRGAGGLVITVDGELVNLASPSKLTHSAIQQVCPKNSHYSYVCLCLISLFCRSKVFGSKPSVVVEGIKRKRGSLSHRELASVIGSRATGHLRHRRANHSNGNDHKGSDHSNIGIGEGKVSHRLIAELVGSRATARAVRRRSRTTSLSSTTTTTTTTTTTAMAATNGGTESKYESSSPSSGSGDAPKLSHAEIAAQIGGKALRYTHCRHFYFSRVCRLN